MFHRNTTGARATAPAPLIEGLEDRRLLSAAPTGLALPVHANGHAANHAKPSHGHGANQGKSPTRISTTLGALATSTIPNAAKAQGLLLTALNSALTAAGQPTVTLSQVSGQKVQVISLKNGNTVFSTEVEVTAGGKEIEASITLDKAGNVVVDNEAGDDATTPTATASVATAAAKAQSSAKPAGKPAKPAKGAPKFTTVAFSTLSTALRTALQTSLNTSLTTLGLPATTITAGQLVRVHALKNGHTIYSTELTINAKEVEASAATDRAGNILVDNDNGGTETETETD